MKKFNLLFLVVLCLFCSCRTVKKTSSQEKTSGNFIANSSLDSSAHLSVDSVAFSNSVDDYDESTTITFPEATFIQASKLTNLNFSDTASVHLPAGTTINYRRKGKLQTSDTTHLKKTGDVEVKNKSQAQATIQHQAKDSSKSVSSFSWISILLIVLLIAIYLYFNRK